MRAKRAFAVGLTISLAVVGTVIPANAATKTTKKVAKTTKTTKKVVTTAAPAATAAPATNAPVTTAAGASNAEFTVMVTGDFTSTISFPVKEALAAVKAALKDVPNAKVVGCDTKTDPNAAQGCARDAVSQKVAVVINAFSPLAADPSILTKAGIAFVGQTDLTGATSFALAAGVPQYTGMGYGFIKSGCISLGVLHYDGTDFLVDAINNGAKAAGGSVSTKAAIPSNTPDLAPAIAKLTGAGVDCIALSISPGQVPQAMTAISQSGVKLKVGGVGALFPKPVITAIGRLSEGILVFEAQANADDVSPVLTRIKTEMQTFDKDAQMTQQAVLSWAAGRLVAKAAASTKGPVTASSLLASLEALANVDLEGVMAPLSLNGQKAAAYKRLVNTKLLTYQIKDGLPRRTGEFFDYGFALPGN